jgi:hypothetical protein
MREYRKKHPNRKAEWVAANKERVQEYGQSYVRSARGKYANHKGHATTRGIEFKLTFDEWWELWEPHYAERGTGRMVMCRTNDEGPYEMGNVRIDTQSNNAMENHNGR